MMTTTMMIVIVIGVDDMVNDVESDDTTLWVAVTVTGGSAVAGTAADDLT